MADTMTQIISLIHTRAASYDAMAADEWEHAAACATALRSVADDLRPLLAEIAAKDAEIARLREAMAPFYRMAGAMFARNWNRDGVAISFVDKDGPIRLTFADFLAVRAALKGDTHE